MTIHFEETHKKLILLNYRPTYLIRKVQWLSSFFFFFFFLFFWGGGGYHFILDHEQHVFTWLHMVNQQIKFMKYNGHPVLFNF